MKSLTQWFDLYGESHQNQTNILIHKVAVPLIYFSVVALIFSIPGLIGDIVLGVTCFAALTFYFLLNIKLGLLMSVYTGICIYCAALLNDNIVVTAVAIFVVAWIFQFVGHKIEGKKPSFFDDVQFLLIGPAWVFQKLFR